MILKGNLAPEGCVIKVAGHRQEDRIAARRACSTAKKTPWQAVTGGKIKAGDVVVIRYEGPRGGRDARDAGRDRRDRGRGTGRQRRAADRRPVQRRHARLHGGHVAPEAFNGGPIAAVGEGDAIIVDAERGVLDLDIPEAEIARRLSQWKPRDPRYQAGVFAKYCKLVSSASEGAVTRV